MNRMPPDKPMTFSEGLGAFLAVFIAVFVFTGMYFAIRYEIEGYYVGGLYTFIGVLVYLTRDKR